MKDFYQKSKNKRNNWYKFLFYFLFNGIKLKYTEERNQVFNELSSLRENLSKKKTTPKALQAQGKFNAMRIGDNML